MNRKCMCAFVFLMFWLNWTNISTAQDDHAKVLSKLANDFKNILSKTKQYAVLYITNSNSVNGQVEYKPMKLNVMQDVVFPLITAQMLEKHEYPYTYSAMIPDYGGKHFWNILNRKTMATIHTEDIALNLVFPFMKNWFMAKYNVSEVNNVYLYSYLLPCTDCTNIISNFLQSNGHIRLYVGFSQLYWVGETIEQATMRKMELEELLQNRGKFYNIKCYSKAKRRKRDLDEDCYLNETRKRLSLMLNFSSGAVIVQLVGLPNGTLVLKDKNDNLVETKKASNNDENTLAFPNNYMNEGYYAIFKGEHNKLQLQTEPWFQCGFGWEGMHALPVHYDEVLIQLQIQDGSPFVCLQSANFSVMQFDIVQLEGIYKNDSTLESNMAYVNQFNVSETESISRCYKFSRLTQDFSEGFRVKYIYCNSYNNCSYAGLYDNASPFWTPEYCFCGDCFHVEHVTGSACGNKGASAARILSLIFILFQLIY